MRLFAAFLLEEKVRSALSRVASGLARSCDGVRWVPAEQVHLTVKFLGEVPDRDVTRVAEAMARGAELGQAFELEIGRCGCFPPGGPVRIVWAEAKEESGAMARSVEAICDELATMGFPRESRAWSPHLTIGRVKEDSSRGRIRAAVEACTVPVMRQRVRAVTLMQSVLSPRGSTYTPVSQAELGSAGEPS